MDLPLVLLEDETEVVNWYSNGCDFSSYSPAYEVTKFFGEDAKLNRVLSIRYNRFRKLALDAMYQCTDVIYSVQFY